MKKILVISDNHQDQIVLENILKNEDYDLSVHLGDSQMEEKKIKMMFDYYVGGNNDYFSILEDHFEYEGLKFSILHGHTQYISILNNVDPALKFGKINKANIVLHGHTHIPCNVFKDNVLIICPGSTTFPRANSKKQYAILHVKDKKVYNVEFKNVNDLNSI